MKRILDIVGLRMPNIRLCRGGDKRRARAVPIEGALSIIGIVAATMWGAQRAPANVSTPGSVDAALSAGLEATWSAVVANPGCPKDPVKLQQAVANAFPILHPELANIQLLNDANFAQARLAAYSTILDPHGTEARSLADLQERSRREVALASLTKGLQSVNDPAVQSQRASALHAIATRDRQ